MTKREEIVFDLEISKNYFLCGFKKIKDGKVLQIDTKTCLNKEQIKKIKTVLQSTTLITFNGNRYDIPMLLKALEGVSTMELFEMSKTIIKENLPTFMIMNKFELENLPYIDAYDLVEPAPAVFVSLKKYGTRLGSKRLQDLPYAYDKILSDTEIDVIRDYNINDLDVTIDLYRAIEGRIRLREDMSKEYGMDLRSKSDAQIGEQVILKALKKVGINATKASVPTQLKYKAPSCISFESEMLNKLLHNVQNSFIKINQKNGQPVMPSWLKETKIVIGDTEYEVGLGGLHSKEKKLVVKATNTTIIRNADVAAMYPAIILEYGFYPERLTKKFLSVYKSIVTKRLKAKSDEKTLPKGSPEQIRAGLVNAGLKISINGSYGKFGSMYSKLYAPDLMIQTTLTGQLTLLMLIEQMELNGFSVVSANTDGFEYICSITRQDEAEAIIFDWELITGLDMEHGSYNALYARDVNSYVAVYPDDIKAKGVYAEPTLSKDSEYPIVFESVRQFLAHSTPIEDTVRACNDIKQFTTARTVKYGGWWRGKYLGKTVRFAYATDGDKITFTSPKTGKTDNKVAKSDGCRPLMILPDVLPEWLDKNRYIEIAIKALADLGVTYDMD